VVRKRCVTVERGEDGVMSYSNSTLTAQPRGLLGTVYLYSTGCAYIVPKTASRSTRGLFTGQAAHVLVCDSDSSQPSLWVLTMVK
jgi:hypothetical protein